MDRLSTDERMLLQRIHGLWRKARRARWMLVAFTALTHAALCTSLGLVLGLAPIFVGALTALGFIGGAAWTWTRPKLSALDCAYLLDRALHAQNPGARASICAAYALVANAAQNAAFGGLRKPHCPPWLEAIAQAANCSYATLAPTQIPTFGPSRVLLGLWASAVVGATILALAVPTPGLGRMQVLTGARTTAHRNAAMVRATETARPEIVQIHAHDSVRASLGVTENAGERDALRNTRVSSAAFLETAHSLDRDTKSLPESGTLIERVTKPETADFPGATGQQEAARSAAQTARDFERLAREPAQRATGRGDAPEAPAVPRPKDTEAVPEHAGDRTLQRLSREVQKEQPPALENARTGGPQIAGAESAPVQQAAQKFEEAARGAAMRSFDGTRPSELTASSKHSSNGSGGNDVSALGGRGVAGGASLSASNDRGLVEQSIAQEHKSSPPDRERGFGQGAGDAVGAAALARKIKGDSDFAGHPSKIDLGVGSGPVHAQIIEISASEGFSSPAYATTFSAYTTVIENTLARDVVPPARRELVQRYFRLIRPRNP